MQAASKAKVGESGEGEAALKDLRKLSVAELRELLLKAGVTEEDLKGMPAPVQAAALLAGRNSCITSLIVLAS